MSGIPRPAPAMRTPERRPPAVPHSAGLSSFASARGDRTSSAAAVNASTHPSACAVQVAVRIRPVTSDDQAAIPPRWQRTAVLADGPARVRFDPSPGPAPASAAIATAAAASSDYIYDRVFPPDGDQATVYAESVQPLVPKFFAGYNTTILAYGQTRSGKSYTMGTTPAHDPTSDPHTWSPETGLIPRTIADIFDHIQRDTSPGSYALSVSFIELYNEDLIDLLAQSDRPAELRPLVQIRQDKGHVVWSGMNDVHVQDVADVLALLAQGTARRRTNQTDMNSQSSRSHAVFSLTLAHKHPIASSAPRAAPSASPSQRRPSAPPISPSASLIDSDRPSSSLSGMSSRQSRSAIPRPQSALSRVGEGAPGSSAVSPTEQHQSTGSPRAATQPPSLSDAKWVTTTSKFHFVDLAGSERLNRTMSKGDRYKEGISINSGLHALGNVISALADVARGKAAHVPYRDSKLTRLLQDSLGGNAYTLMIACVSPTEYNLSETINTLQYAARARAVKSKPEMSEREPGWDDLSHMQALGTTLRQDLQEVCNRPSASAVNVRDPTSDAQEAEEARETIRRQQDQLAAMAEEIAQLKSDKVRGSSPQSTEPIILEYEKSMDVLTCQVNLLKADLGHSGDVIGRLEQQIASQEHQLAEQEAVSAAQKKQIDALEVQIAAQAGPQSAGHEATSSVASANTSDGPEQKESVAGVHAELRELKAKYASVMAELASAQQAHQDALMRAELLSVQLADVPRQLAEPPRSIAPRPRHISGDELEVLSGNGVTDHEDGLSVLFRRNSTGTRRETWHPTLGSRSNGDADSVSSSPVPAKTKEPSSSGRISRRSSLNMSRSTPLISPSPRDRDASSRPLSRAHRRSKSSIAYRPADAPAAARDLNDVTLSSRQTSPDNGQGRHTRTASGSSQVGHRPLSLLDMPSGLNDSAYAAAAEEAQRKIRSLEQERDTLQALLFQREDELDGLQRALDSPATRTSVSSSSLVLVDKPILAGTSEGTLPPQNTAHVHELMTELAAQENQHKDKVVAQLADYHNRLLEQDEAHAKVIAKRDEAAATLARAHLALQERYAIAQVTAAEATEQADAAKSKVTWLEAQLETLRTEHEDTISALKLKHKNALAEDHEAHARALSELSEHQDDPADRSILETLRDEHAGELQRMKYAHEKEIETLKLFHTQQLAEQDDASKGKLASLEQAHQSACRDLEQLRTDHAGEKASIALELGQRDAQLNRLKEENASLRRAVDEARASSAQYEERVAQLASQVEVDPVEMDMLKAELAETSDALVVLEDALTEAQGERDQAARDLAHLRGDSSPATSGGGTIRGHGSDQERDGLTRELETHRSLLAQTRSELSRARADVQASQAECARNAALLREAQHRLSQMERSAAHRSAGWTQRNHLDEPNSGRVSSWGTNNSHRTTSSSGSGKAPPPPPPTVPPAGPPPPPPQGLPAATLNRPSSLAESVSSLSAGHGPNAGPSPGASPMVTVPVEERQRTLDEVQRLQNKLTHAEAEQHASSDLVATLEAALNDSERNLRKARTQLSEVTRERDAFSAQSAELQAQLEAATEEVAKAQSRVTEQREALEKEIEQERAARDKALQVLSARLEEVTKRKSSRLFCI